MKNLTATFALLLADGSCGPRGRRLAVAEAAKLIDAVKAGHSWWSRRR